MRVDALAKLQWQCRRGTKELDYLLERFLRQQFKAADKAEQLLFVTLLELPDAQLTSYLLGEQLPASPRLATLVKKIRNTPFV